MVWFWNGRDQRIAIAGPFPNLTIGNPNFKTFGIPMCLVFKPSLYFPTFSATRRLDFDEGSTVANNYLMSCSVADLTRAGGGPLLGGWVAAPFPGIRPI